MSFSDVLKKSFLEGFTTMEIGTSQIFIALILALVISIWIYFCYKMMTRRTFYSKSFNLSLIALALLTTGIILTIQSSIVVSLGMVGALSIVRFRTAIKEPMDLVFLFWSISIGIMCGAGLSKTAVIVTLLVTLVIFIFNRIPVAHAPMILTVNYKSDASLDEKVLAVIKKAKYYKVKSRSVTKEQISLVCEVRVRDDVTITNELAELDGVSNATLLSHDGEVTF